MARMLPEMRLRNGDRCTGLVSNCWTLKAMRRTEEPRPKGWTALTNCPDCCPPCLDDESWTGIPSMDGRYWADGSPAQDEYFGILVKSIDLEPVYSNRRRGDTTLENAAYKPRRLLVTGTHVASSEAGLIHGESKLEELLTTGGPCNGCPPEWDVELWTHCGDQQADSPLDRLPWKGSPIPDPPDPVETCVPCGDQLVRQPLGVDKAADPGSVDTGKRSLLRARLVYVEGVDDDDTPLCDGRQVVMLFEILTEESFGEPVPVGCFQGGFDTMETAIENTFLGPREVRVGGCRQFDWNFCRPIPTDDVNCRPARPAWLAEGDTGETSRSGSTIAGRYCMPLYRSVRSCLLPQLPGVAEYTLRWEATAANGADAVNIGVEIWPAFSGLPDPQTCEGEKEYRKIVPCESSMVPWIPAGQTLCVAGDTQDAVLTCPTAATSAADDLLEGRFGARHTFPKLEGTCRYWLVVTNNCLSPIVDFKAWIVPVFRS